jgi:hypothetical protein
LVYSQDYALSKRWGQLVSWSTVKTALTKRWGQLVSWSVGVRSRQHSARDGVSWSVGQLVYGQDYAFSKRWGQLVSWRTVKTMHTARDGVSWSVGVQSRLCTQQGKRSPRGQFGERALGMPTAQFLTSVTSIFVH